jgi:hypothetical protein
MNSSLLYTNALSRCQFHLLKSKALPIAPYGLVSYSYLLRTSSLLLAVVLVNDYRVLHVFEMYVLKCDAANISCPNLPCLDSSSIGSAREINVTHVNVFHFYFVPILPQAPCIIS